MIIMASARAEMVRHVAEKITHISIRPVLVLDALTSLRDANYGVSLSRVTNMFTLPFAMAL